MATIEQLEAALRKADAAGNTDDARALANAIRQARAKPDFSNVQATTTRSPGAAAAKPLANNSEFARLIAGDRYTPEQRAAQARRRAMTPQQREAQAQQDADAYEIAKARTGTGPTTHAIGQTANYFDALQHHGLNALHGLAQFGVHGLHGMGVVSDKTVADEDEAIRQRERHYQKRTDGGNAATYLGAGIGEVAPWMVGVGEAKAAGYLPTITATGIKGLAQKGGLLAAEGAAMGATQPVIEGGDYGAQKAQQVAVGAVAAPALAGGTAVAGKAAMGAGRLARYATEGGRERIANERLAKLYGADPSVVQQLRQGTNVPGYELTPAQALGTPEAVQAERVLRNSAKTAPAFAERESANNAALRDAVAGVAKTDADVAAARQARKAATDPYYAQLKGKRVDPASVLQALDGLGSSSLGVRPNIKSAAASLRAEIQSRLGPDGKIDAEILSGLHENAGSHLGPMASGQEKVALGPIKDSIADALDAAVPGYRANLAAYGAASQPLNDMAAGRALLGAIDSGRRDAGGNQVVDLTKVRALLAKDAKSKHPMSAQARQTIENVMEAIQRRGVADNSVAAAGPGSAADMLRGISSSPTAMRIIGHLASAGGGAFGGLPGYALGALTVEGANAANNSVLRKMATKAASAHATADAIEAAGKKNGGKLAQLTQQMPAYLLPYR